MNRKEILSNGTEQQKMCGWERLPNLVRIQMKGKEKKISSAHNIEVVKIT